MPENAAERDGLAAGEGGRALGDDDVGDRDLSGHVERDGLGVAAGRVGQGDGVRLVAGGRRVQPHGERRRLAAASEVPGEVTISKAVLLAKASGSKAIVPALTLVTVKVTTLGADPIATLPKE